VLIFFVGTGRLGNQLFQLNGIEYITRNIKNRTFILLNMPDLNKALNININCKYINSKIATKLYDHYVYHFFHLLYYLRLIGTIFCEYDYLKGCKQESNYKVQYGLLPFIWIPTLYFQKKRLINNAVFSIKEQHIKKAETLLKTLPQYFEPIYIHIRKTDYINFEVLGKLGADLPLSYYYKAINIINKDVKNPYFIFLTDDPNYIKQYFHDISNKTISTLDQYADLALMSLCKYGIISNSSFSWWGSYFMKDRKRVIAPRYWLGFKSKLEYPSGIIADWMEVIDF